MNHGSLFSGIGGFDLAAEWMGWNNVFHCEWNPFGQRVLTHYWPNAKSYNDITKSDFSIHRGQIDILTGGFPCQPYSSAGKRLGKEDDRHLWPEMLRAIREIQPRWVVGENVRGLTNWNGGLVFDEVQADLETEGYQVTPFLLPACAVNSQQIRDRIWFIAYSDKVSGIGMGIGEDEDIEQRKAEEWGKNRQFVHMVPCGTSFEIGWSGGQRSVREPALISKSNGVPAGLAGTSFRDYIEYANGAYGNAIVPQVALQLFKAVDQYEQLQKQLNLFAA